MTMGRAATKVTVRRQSIIDNATSAPIDVARETATLTAVGKMVAGVVVSNVRREVRSPPEKAD